MIIWTLTGAVGLGAVVLGTTGALILHAGATKKEPDCDFIIVLGSKLEEGGCVTMNERLDRAYRYLTDHPETMAILSGGQGEAAYMHRALTTAGIHENRLILEEKSLNTWQNLKYSLPLVRENEPKRVGILSSEFHLFRAKMYIKGQKIALIPAKTKDFKRWLHNFCREIAGVWHYILLGGTYD